MIIDAFGELRDQLAQVQEDLEVSTGDTLGEVGGYGRGGRVIRQSGCLEEVRE